MRHLKQIFFIGFLLVSLFCFASCVAELVRDSPQFFGYRGDGLFEIYVARLDGQGFRSIVSDSWRQMSHPRISPDGQWLTFTRYNRRCRDGLAIEDGADYSASEIVIARIDGSAVRSLTPPSPVTANANSSWVDGGSALIYCHCSGRHALPELRKIDVRTGRITHVPTPTGWIVADPHELRGKIVFTVIPSENKKGDLADSLWVMNSDGSRLRRLTRPVIEPTSKKRPFRLGDYDPSLSPDGAEVVFMRQFGGDDWRVFKVDTSSGKEVMLTEPGCPSGIPKWSSDGRLITFVCFDNRDALKHLGLYTITADGSQRTKLPLPTGYLYTHPNFFPDDGSGSDARLVFGAWRVPALP